MKLIFKIFILLTGQSTKTDRTKHKAIDGHKKVKGVKIFKIVDRKSNTLLNYVTTANVNDKKGLKYIINKFAWRNWFNIKELLADKGFESKGIQRECYSNYNIEFKPMKTIHNTTNHNVWKPIYLKALKLYNASISKIRWHVEQAFAWENGYRRLSKNYEYLHNTFEAMRDIADIYLSLKRI